HTYGTPFFSPYYNPANHFTVWGSAEVLRSLRAVLDPRSDLSRLYFPPTTDLMQAIKEFRTLEAGMDFPLRSTPVRPHALNHRGGCRAFRLANGGRAYVSATDHEHTPGPDAGLVEFARGADVLYTEGQYTLAEYEGREGISGDPPSPRRGWGHSPV